jgi:FlaA1/EpsC-like NDP-sugar epimerase
VADVGFRDDAEPKLLIRTDRKLRWFYRALEAACDAVSWLGGLVAAGWVTGDLAGSGVTPAIAARAALAVCALAVATGLLAGMYRGRYQRGSFDELIGIGRAGAAMFVVLVILGGHLLPGQQARLHTVAGGTVFALLAMAGARHLVTAGRQWSRMTASSGVKIIVFGAGNSGAQLVHGLAHQPGAGYQPVAFLDDDPAKRRLRIHGVPVLGDRTRIAEVAARTGATVLVIALTRASGSTIRDLSHEAERCGLTPKVIPSATEMVGGSALIDGVRNLRITDLLGRRPVTTDLDAVAGYFTGKRVLVTGAGGSIGSELCRQLHGFGPAELIMVDRDESALHAIELALHGRAMLDSEQVVLADIRDPESIRQVFEHCRPEIVFHAAALKHLPLLERYPAEALKTNALGTLGVLEAAAACGVESFVNISTDKAADPECVLGFTKRVAERLTAHMAGRATGTYLSVRFGNVLGSRGSFLTAFSAQAAAGGPLTVTHPEVSRYFMTAGEAVQLVLQAAVIGRDGEVLVLDMGEQMRIADIARRLAASAPGQVDIVFTGLRPGEKLTESLLGAAETGEILSHPLIRHVPVPPLSPEFVTGLDPGLPADELRAELARCAGQPGRDRLLQPAGQPGRDRDRLLLPAGQPGRDRDRLLQPAGRAMTGMPRPRPARQVVPADGPARQRLARTGAAGPRSGRPRRHRESRRAGRRGPCPGVPGGPSQRVARRPASARSAGRGGPAP